MESHDFLLVIFIVLFSAKLFGSLFERLSMPPVLGEIVAGIILGPSLLGIVEIEMALKILAEIGIVLLLFEVGLETDISKLLQAGWYSIVTAILGFVLPLLFGFALSYYYFGFDLILSLFIGGTITATSIGITVRVLQDLGKRKTLEGEIVVGAAVIDDIFGVLLLALLYEFSKAGRIEWIQTGKFTLFIIGFLIIAPVAAKIIAALLQKYHLKSEQARGVLATSIFMLVVFFAWLAYEVGAPEIIGGFAAGLALSRRFIIPFGIALASSPRFAQQIEDEIKPLIYLFAPFFFVTVGVSTNLKEIDWGSAQIWILFGSLFVAAVIGKLIGSLFLPLPWKKRFIIGFSMIPRGEVGLIFAEMGRLNGIFDNVVYSALLLVIITTTLFPPFIIKWLYKG